MGFSVSTLLQDNESFFQQMATDPYPVFRQLREHGPIHWIEPMNMWYAVDHEAVSRILLDTEAFVTGAPGTLIFDTFGRHMLTVDGPDQIRYRMAFRAAFSPVRVKRDLMPRIQTHVDQLIDQFADRGSVELREHFASRLPILVILDVFGLPLEFEHDFRNWYDDFEAGLANFENNSEVRKRASASVGEFHKLLQGQIDAMRGHDDDSLLGSVINQAADKRLSDEEIRCNALIILFGGISTVEALLLNTLYAIFSHDQIKSDLMEDSSGLPDLIEESVRWISPVQSATRHVAKETEISGVTLEKGDTVNCMLAAANRDPKLFSEPDQFLPGRDNVKRHLGFATGPHVCLGNNLARAEGRIGIETLFSRLANLRLNSTKPVNVRGYEFRQPKALWVEWDV